MRSFVPALLAIVLGACGEGGGSTEGSATTTTTEPATMTAGESSTAPVGTESSGESSTGTTVGESSSGPADTSGTDEGPTDSTDGSTTEAGPPQVVFETTLGTIVFELDELAAPVTAANFLTYLDGGFFDGADGNGATIFHRVIPGFVVQGGGLTEALVPKATLPPIVNEFGNGLTNVRGSISMARTPDPDSATSQFFINLVDNPGLDQAPGYAVFGRVVEGIEVVDAMAAVATTTMGQYEDVPIDPILVLSATRG